MGFVNWSHIIFISLNRANIDAFKALTFHITKTSSKKKHNWNLFSIIFSVCPFLEELHSLFTKNDSKVWVFWGQLRTFTIPVSCSAKGLVRSRLEYASHIWSRSINLAFRLTNSLTVISSFHSLSLGQTFVSLFFCYCLNNGYYFYILSSCISSSQRKTRLTKLFRMSHIFFDVALQLHT